MTDPHQLSADKRPKPVRTSRLHRILGLLVGLPLMFLVATGVPLQFTDALQLGSRLVQADWLLDRYGIAAATNAVHSGGAMAIGDLLVVGDRDIRIDQPLVGAAALGPYTAVALSQQLLLIPQDPQIPLESVSLPDRATQFAVHQDHLLFVDTASGYYSSDDFGSNWQQLNNPTDLPRLSWRTTSRAEASVEQQNRERANKLSWERVIQDLHSGRFFGPVGVWVMTLANLGLVILAFTGLFLWARVKR